MSSFGSPSQLVKSKNRPNRARQAKQRSAQKERANIAGVVRVRILHDQRIDAFGAAALVPDALLSNSFAGNRRLIAP